MVVAYSDVVVGDIVVGNIDECMGVLAVIDGCIDDGSKIDVIMFELRSEVGVVEIVSMLVSSIDDDVRGSFPIELEILFIAVLVVAAVDNGVVSILALDMMGAVV